MIRFKNILHLMRWWNGILGVSPFLVVLFVLFVKSYDESGCSFDLFNLLTLCLCVFLLMSSGFVFNDIIDNEIDKVNRPDQYSIGKNITELEAKHLFIFISILILIFSTYLTFYSFSDWGIISLVVYTLLIIYSLFLKQMPILGNIVIAGLISFLPIVILFYADQCLAELANQDVVGLIYCYAVFSFFVMLSREINLDIEDKEGDFIGGCRTLPIVLGIKKTKIIIIIIILLSMLISLVLIYLYKFLVFPYIIINLLLSFYCFKLWKANKKSDFIESRKFIKFILILGLLGFAISVLLH